MKEDWPHISLCSMNMADVSKGVLGAKINPSGPWILVEESGGGATMTKSASPPVLGESGVSGATRGSVIQPDPTSNNGAGLPE